MFYCFQNLITILYNCYECLQLLFLIFLCFYFLNLFIYFGYEPQLRPYMQYVVPLTAAICILLI